MLSEKDVLCVLPSFLRRGRRSRGWFLLRNLALDYSDLNHPPYGHPSLKRRGVALNKPYANCERGLCKIGVLLVPLPRLIVRMQQVVRLVAVGLSEE